MALTRSIVSAYVEEARQKKQNRRRWVEKRLKEDFPEEVLRTIQQGSKTVTVLEAILDDLSSYGKTS